MMIICFGTIIVGPLNFKSIIELIENELKLGVVKLTMLDKVCEIHLLDWQVTKEFIQFTYISKIN